MALCPLGNMENGRAVWRFVHFLGHVPVLQSWQPLVPPQLPPMQAWRAACVSNDEGWIVHTMRGG